MDNGYHLSRKLLQRLARPEHIYVKLFAVAADNTGDISVIYRIYDLGVLGMQASHRAIYPDGNGFSEIMLYLIFAFLICHVARVLSRILGCAPAHTARSSVSVI